MKFETKMNIKDKMYVITHGQNHIEKVCKICSGSGKVKLRDEKYTCPECYGSGEKTTVEDTAWYVWNYISGIKVGQIRIEHDKSGKTNIMYHPTNMGNYFYEDCVFKTLKKAEEECNKRNNLEGEENL